MSAEIALLESRCAAIDQHYARFPDSLDRTMEDTAKAIRAVLLDRAEKDARLHVITADEARCPACENTKADAADRIAEIAVAYAETAKQACE